MSNPWTLLDIRDLRGPPRSERQRVLDDVIENLRTLATLSQDRRVTKDDTIFEGLSGGGDIDEVITLIMRMRQVSSSP